VRSEKPALPAPKRTAQELQRAYVVRSATLLYCFMTAFCFAWGFWRGDPDFFNHPAPAVGLPWPAAVGAGAAAGALFGLLVAWLSRVAVRRAAWARALAGEMRTLLGPLTAREAFYLAALSALSEELFFRGILQAHLGLVVSSLVFGLAHFPKSRLFVAWTLEAVCLGFCLGALFLVSGNLMAPIAAHFTINFVNLRFILRTGTPA